MARVELPGAALNAMAHGKNLVNEHSRVYRGAEEAFFKRAGLSDRERTLAGKLGDAAAVAKTNELGDATEFQGRGRQPGMGASLIRRATAVSKASNPAGVQAGLDEIGQNQLDRERKIGALKYGTGQAGASSAARDSALSRLASADLLEQQVREAQKTRDRNAQADAIGSTMSFLGGMGSDGKAGKTENGFSKWLGDIGFTNPVKDASYAGQVSNGDETGHETTQLSGGTRFFDWLGGVFK